MFLPIYCSGIFFEETESEKIHLITGENSRPFYSKKMSKKRS